MKNKFTLFLSLFFLLLLAVSSCDVQKRRYRNGFYFEGRSDAVHSSRPRGDSEKLPVENELWQRPAGTQQEPAITKDKNIGEKKLPGRNFLPAKNKYAFPKRFKIDIPFKPAAEKIITSRKKIVEEIDFNEERKIKNLYIAAFVCGIAGFFLIFPAIAAIILYSIANKRARNFSYRIENAGLGKAGFILGLIICCLILLELIFILPMIFTSGAFI